MHKLVFLPKYKTDFLQKLGKKICVGKYFCCLSWMSNLFCDLACAKGSKNCLFLVAIATFVDKLLCKTKTVKTVVHFRYPQKCQ